MASGALGAFVGFVATALAAWLLYVTWTRSPRLAALRPRSRVEPAQPGPVAQLALVARSAGIDPFRAAIEEETRAQLRAWAHARGVAPDAIPDAARAGRLRVPPVLLHALDHGGEAAWSREVSLAGFRGPRILFPFWSAFARLTESRDARTLRYLDALTRALQETVDA